MVDSFGNRVRILRSDLNLSQQELADLVGVSRKQISDYEIGKSRPRSKTLHRLAQALKVESIFLIPAYDDDPLDLSNKPKAVKIDFNDEELKIIENSARIAGRSIEDEVQYLVTMALRAEINRSKIEKINDLPDDAAERLLALEEKVKELEKIKK